jgi:hypothetical protein
VRLRPPGGTSFAVAVTVIDGGPVAAAVGVPSSASASASGSGSGGLTWAGSAAPDGILTGDQQAEVWVPPLPDRSAGALVMTAPDASATAWLDGGLIRVPAGHTVTVALKAGFPGGRLVTVDGPVVAAQQLRPAPAGGNDAGPGWPSSVTAITAVPRVVDVPELVSDPRLVSGRVPRNS